MTTNEDNLQENLEKKITEAEMEAQIEENKTKEEANSSFDAEVVEKQEPAAPKKTEMSKARKIWRRVLIWLVVLAITFSGGFFLDSLMRYGPEKALVEVLKSDLQVSQDEITTLQAEIERLGPFEDQNTALKEDNAAITTHLTLLSVRAAVADATLAIVQDRMPDAKLALDKVGSSLDSLKTMLNKDQVEVVDNMIQRHQLILIELNDDGFSAITDLEVLATKLNTLENTLYAAP